MPAVEVSGLSVRYGELTAVDGLDLRASAGEVVVVLGRNGAGKTSAIESMEGYRQRSAGEVKILGLDPQHRREHSELAGRIGVMLQQGGVYPALSAVEAVRLFAAYYPRPEDPDQLLQRIGLAGEVARRPWRRLSGGEQRRVSLALALVGRPEVVFLDEPTAGVDVQGRITIRKVIADLRDAGVCVVVTTHELDEAERVADRIAIVEGGRVVATDTLERLLGSASAGLTQIRFSAPADLDTSRLEVPVTRDGDVYTAQVPDTEAGRAVAQITNWLGELGLPVERLRVGHPSLEDVFLRLTGGDHER